MCVCVLVPPRLLTFVVGGVVDAEITVPDDGQLHGKTAHLHPIVGVLSPWQPESERKKKRARERTELFSNFKRIQTQTPEATHTHTQDKMVMYQQTISMKHSIKLLSC